jgi:hypothetical protein
MDTRKRKRNSATLTAAEIDRATKKLKSSHASPAIKTLSDQPDLSLSRFCTATQIANKGKPPLTKVTWDSDKLQCSLSPAEAEDHLLVHNIATGCIFSGNLWPLVLENSSNPLAQKRSLAFMEHVVATPHLLTTLNEEELLFFGVGVRDLWLADSRGHLSSNEKKLLSQVVELIDDDLMASAEFQGMTFSFCPSKNRRVLKAIEHLEELTSSPTDDFTQMFARMVISGAEQVSFYFVWVDARELSYHNLEFILPLDRALTRSNTQKDLLDFTFTDVKPLSKSLHIIKCRLGGADTDLLLQLDSLGLYQKPSNHSTRGGERFVFSSAALSRGLTEAIKSSDVLPSLAKTARSGNSSFAFVNYVFRCNRFAPGDAKFQMHLDTPYYDSSRNHISKYTILIYLSGGSADSILKVMGNGSTKSNAEVNVTQVQSLECVIFDQQYEHEGQPFIDGNKIFLRSELIFEDNNIKHEPEISKLFSSAVYMTLESAFQPELSRHAHELYERVNAAHWGNKKTKSAAPPVLHKCFGEQMHFASNGFDYWFPFVTKEKTDQSSFDLSSPLRFLKLAAVVAVLDYFNCNLNSNSNKEGDTVMSAFRSQCTSRTIKPPKKATSSDWIMARLWSSLGKLQSEGRVQAMDREAKKTLFEESLQAERYKRVKGQYEECCCPFHCPPEEYADMSLGPDEQTIFRAWHCTDVVECYKQVCKTSEEKLLGAPLMMLDSKLCLDASSIVVEDDKIFITNDAEHKPRCNFAACWNWSTPEAFIDVERTIPTVKLVVPPITFVPVLASDKSGPGFRLMLDFFNNDWMLPSEDEVESKVLIPNMEGAGREVVEGLGLTRSFGDDE